MRNPTKLHLLKESYAYVGYHPFQKQSKTIYLTFLQIRTTITLSNFKLSNYF